jgi:hypothetical protein
MTQLVDHHVLSQRIHRCLLSPSMRRRSQRLRHFGETPNNKIV